MQTAKPKTIHITPRQFGRVAAVAISKGVDVTSLIYSRCKTIAKEDNKAPKEEVKPATSEH